MHGNGGSPILSGDNLIFNCDGKENPYVVALNKDTGKVVWRTYRPNTEASNKFSICTPTLIDVAGKKQVVSPGSGAVCAYDPSDGKELWRVTYGRGFSVVPRPAAGNGMVYVSSGFSDATVYAIRTNGSGDVTGSHLVWKFPRKAPKTPSPLLIGTELYLIDDTGTVSCRDAITGEPFWKERLKGNYSSSPICAGDNIYIVSEKGVITVLKAGKTFHKLAENDMEEKTFATPAVMDNALIIRTETKLYRIEQSNDTIRHPKSFPASRGLHEDRATGDRLV
jgi:outer membrane protein assembly factor BamB